MVEQASFKGEDEVANKPLLSQVLRAAANLESLTSSSQILDSNSTRISSIGNINIVETNTDNVVDGANNL